MENRTVFDYFEIMAFSSSTMNRPLLFALFFIIYLIGLLGNITIISCVANDVRLHTPMYISLGNLSVVDMIFTSSTLPKLLDIFLTRNNLMSAIECFTQMFFYLFAAGTEDILLSFMAYDRYVAICKPLYYKLIMSNHKLILFLLYIWTAASGNALFFTLSIFQVNICYSNKIQHFFCETKALDRITCPNIRLHLILYFEIIFLGLLPFLLSLLSYVKIISVVLSIPSTTGRKKAFSTCTSHLTVLATYYGAGICMYVKPPSEHLEEQDLVFSTLYTAVTPMLNPIIYSLRNQEVKAAIKNIISSIFSNKSF